MRLFSRACNAVICRRTSQSSRVAACAAGPRGPGGVDVGLDEGSRLLEVLEVAIEDADSALGKVSREPALLVDVTRNGLEIESDMGAGPFPEVV